MGVKIFASVLIPLLSIIGHSLKGSDLTWKQARLDREGEITIHYKLNEPFLISNDSLSLEGLEYDMMMGFQEYLYNQYGISIRYEWIERNSLSEIFDRIQSIQKPGEIGLDIISWTADRERNVKFSNPYFPDFQVLVTARSNPTVLHEDEFEQLYEGYTAITVAGTTYERNLQEIQASHDMNFELFYIDKSNRVIESVLQTPRSFGYSDLTRYLLALDKNLPVKRLNAHAIKGHGLGVIFNKNSDWEVPFNEYLLSADFDSIRQRGLDKYFGSDFNAFIENLENRQNEEIVLLMEEKKFMDKEIEEHKKKVEKQGKISNALMLSVFVVLLVSFFLYNRNMIKSKANQELTDHKRTIVAQNVKLGENVEQLMELNEDKNSFIRILSHDLRAPINNINGISKLLLQSSDELNHEQIRLLNHVSDESKRLIDMVTRILDVEKIESRTEEAFTQIEVNEVLGKVLKNFSAAARAKGISLAYDLQGELYVLGIEPFFFHVFDNLLSNAIKFSPHGTTIQVYSKKSADAIEVFFIDEGPGISEEDQGKMFKKFQMLSAKATAGEQSSGLGLSIVDKYVKLLKGQLICKSELGSGTTFIVRFENRTV